MNRGYRCVALGLLLLTVLVGAPNLPVGFATGDSDFSVGKFLIQNHATVFSGDAVRSWHFATRVNLKDGSRYVLGIGSEATVQPDHLVLRSGSLDVTHGGRASRVVAASMSVLADTPGTAATVYITGKDRVSVLVRSGQARISRGAQAVTVTKGELVTFQPGTRGGLQRDSEGALVEVSRVQAEQLESLRQASREQTCLAPRVTTLSNSFAALSSELTANQAARSRIQGRIGAGRATRADLDQMASLNAGWKTLQHSSGIMSAELNDMVLQHQPTIPNISPHSVHGHVVNHEHHGTHGHTEIGSHSGPWGHHTTPPHIP